MCGCDPLSTDWKRVFSLLCTDSFRGNMRSEDVKTFFFSSLTLSEKTGRLRTWQTFFCSSLIFSETTGRLRTWQTFFCSSLIFFESTERLRTWRLVFCSSLIFSESTGRLRTWRPFFCSSLIFYNRTSEILVIWRPSLYFSLQCGPFYKKVGHPCAKVYRSRSRRFYHSAIWMVRCSGLEAELKFFVKVIYLLTDQSAQLLNTSLSVRDVLSSIPGSEKSTQCHQRLSTVATFLQSCVALALSRGDGRRDSLHALRNTASVMKIWFMCYLHI